MHALTPRRRRTLSICPATLEVSRHNADSRLQDGRNRRRCVAIFERCLKKRQRKIYREWCQAARRERNALPHRNRGLNYSPAATAAASCFGYNNGLTITQVTTHSSFPAPWALFRLAQWHRRISKNFSCCRTYSPAPHPWNINTFRLIPRTFTDQRRQKNMHWTPCHQRSVRFACVRIWFDRRWSFVFFRPRSKITISLGLCFALSAPWCPFCLPRFDVCSWRQSCCCCCFRCSFADLLVLLFI